MQIYKANGLNGEITVPDDKSISHRAVLAKAVSESEIIGAECADISYPGFYEQLNKLTGDML